ncbi:hypothetical protein [Methanospirillum sp.]
MQCMIQLSLKTSFSLEKIIPVVITQLCSRLDCIDIHLTRQAEVKGGLIRSLGPSPGKIGKNDVADLIVKAYVIAPEYISRLVHGNLEKESLDEKD